MTKCPDCGKTLSGDGIHTCSPKDYYRPEKIAEVVARVRALAAQHPMTAELGVEDVPTRTYRRLEGGAYVATLTYLCDALEHTQQSLARAGAAWEYGVQ